MADLKQSEETTAKGPKSEIVISSKSKSNNKTLIIVLVIIGVIVILPVILIAVGGFWLSRGDNANKLTENIVEKATGTDVDIDRDGKSINIKTDEGSFSANTGEKLADNFPKSVILYDNQKIISTFNTSDDGNEAWSVTAETDASDQDVANYFVDKYKDWQTVSSFSYETVKSYSYKKDDLSLVVSIRKDSGDTTTKIDYTVSKDNKN